MITSRVLSRIKAKMTKKKEERRIHGRGNIEEKWSNQKEK